MAGRLLGPNRRNGVAIASVVILLSAAYGIAPHWSTTYGAWLVAFTVWMAWFVVTFALWLAEADF